MFLSRGDRDLGVAFQTHPGRQAFITKKLDYKGNLYGDHFLLSDAKSAEKKRLKEIAKQQLTTGTKNAVKIELSQRERRIVERLNQSQS